VEVSDIDPDKAIPLADSLFRNDRGERAARRMVPFCLTMVSLRMPLLGYPFPY
jgi:hypothetical protein